MTTQPKPTRVVICQQCRHYVAVGEVTICPWCKSDLFDVPSPSGQPEGER